MKQLHQNHARGSQSKAHRPNAVQSLRLNKRLFEISELQGGFPHLAPQNCIFRIAPEALNQKRIYFFEGGVQLYAHPQESESTGSASIINLALFLILNLEP